MAKAIEGEILATGLVENIAAYIAACAFPPESFVLAEHFPRQVVADPQERQDLLRFARLADGIDLSLYTSGRVFHRDFELRWERDSRGTRAVYLGRARDLPALTMLDKWQEGLQQDQRSYYLFGAHLRAETLEHMGLPEGQGYYAEVRIPRLLRYPEKARRVRLVVCEYRVEQTHQLQLFRFQDLRPAEGEHESI